MGLLEDYEQAEVNAALAETADSGAVKSERILLTPSFTYSIFLWILKDCVTAAGNAAHGESMDVEAVIGSYLEEYEVKEAG